MEFSDPEKRIFLAFGLIIMIVLLSLYGFVRLDSFRQDKSEQSARLKTQQPPQEDEIVPEKQQIKDPPKEEKRILNTYRNYEYKFVVNYPAEWTRNEGPFEYVFVFGPAGTPIEEQVQIWVKESSILDVLYSDKTEICTEITYAGGVAYRCEGEKGEDSFKYAEVEYNGQFYFLSVEGDLTDERFQSFEEILSNFSILERMQ